MSSPGSNRKIIHVDMDAFYASVEQRDRPELKGKPVVVGGDPKSRGVVAAASYEARKFKIRSAISCAQAYRLCPSAIFVEPDIRKYKKVSEQVFEIFHSVTDLVEGLSLDEAYLDVTENKLGEPLASRVARHIKDRISNELSLTASAGVAPNKFIAKIASDLRKPDGLVVVAPEKVEEFVRKLPVEKLWGVGPVTAKRLHEAGILTTQDIREASPAELESVFGSSADFYLGLSHGIDTRPVETEWEMKSSGAETTFDRDYTDVSILDGYLKELAEDVARDLKKNERRARTITLKLKYADFQVITRSRTLPKYIDDAKVIAGVASELLRDKTEIAERPARLIGVSVSGLISASEPEQLWLEPLP